MSAIDELTCLKAFKQDAEQSVVVRAIIDLDRRVKDLEDTALPERVLLLEKWVGSKEPEATKVDEQQPKATDEGLIEKFSKRIHDRVTESEDADVQPESFEDILRAFAEECRK